MKQYSIIILMIILLSSFALGNSQIKQEAGAGLNLQGGLAHTGYSSNYVNAINENYTYCEVDGSDYNAIATDLNNDNLQDYIFSSKTKISIYDSSCTLNFELIDTISSMPIITDHNYNGISEITFLSNEMIKSYEYIDKTFILTQYNLTTTKDYISCHNPSNAPEFTLCNILKKNTRDVIIINLGRAYNPDGNIINGTKTNQLTDVLYSFDNLNGLSNTETLTNTFYYPVCNVKATTGNQINCELIDRSGEASYGIIITEGTASTTIADITQNSYYIAKVGNVYRLLWSFDYNKTTFRKNFAGMYDLSGNLIIEIEDLGEMNKTSNWMVGDYNKDGSTEACIFQGNSTLAYLHCYNSVGTQIIYQDFSNVLNVTEGFSMADIYGSTYMEVMNVEGLFTYNNTNSTAKKLLSTNINPTLRNGYANPVFSDLSNSVLSFVYADYTGGLIISTDTQGLLCGDGICQDFENAFNCYIDCNVNETFNETGANCESNSDCDTGLCTYGECVQGGNNHECNENSDCISGECSNNQCTKPSLFDNIDASADEIIGDDANSKNMLAIAIMITLMVAIIIAGRSIAGVLAGILVFFVLGIMFAIWGWLNAFILLGFIITALIGVVVLIMIGTGSTG